MKRVVRRPVIAFTALAYLLFWWPLLVESDISGGIFPFGPTLAAIIVTALVLGRPGLRELWDRQIRRPPRRRWYAIVLAVPIVYSLLAVAITLALGATTETDKLNKLAIFPALLIIRIVLAGPLGEELGSRGFALPRLQSRRSARWKRAWSWARSGPPGLPFLISGDSSGSEFAALWVSTPVRERHPHLGLQQHERQRPHDHAASRNAERNGATGPSLRPPWRSTCRHVASFRCVPSVR